MSAHPQPLGRWPGWGGKVLAVFPALVGHSPVMETESKPLLQEGQFPMHRVLHGQVLLPACPAAGSDASGQPCQQRGRHGARTAWWWLVGDATAVGTSPILPLSPQLLAAPGWSMDGRRAAPGPQAGLGALL